MQNLKCQVRLSRLYALWIMYSDIYASDRKHKKGKVFPYMNKVILVGRLTRDPDIRYSSGETQTAVARYTLAVHCGSRCCLAFNKFLFFYNNICCIYFLAVLVSITACLYTACHCNLYTLVKIVLCKFCRNASRRIPAGSSAIKA